MSDTVKDLSERDYQQTLKLAFNDVNSTLGVDGFLAGLVGRKISQAITTTTIANDTEVLTFSESGTTLFAYTVIYTDGSRATLLSAERTS